MKNFILIFIISCFILSCSSGGGSASSGPTDVPQPYCEEGGTEVQFDN